MSPSRTTLEPLKPLVLICSTPVSGHIIPMLTIAEQLVSRGYDVCFVTGSGYRPRVEAAGASFVSVEGYGDFYDLTSWDLDPSWPEGKKHLEGTDCFIHDLVHIFCRSIPSQHHALQTALGTLASKHPGRPTILLTESLNFAAMPILHGAPGLRPTGYIVIGLNPMMLSSIDHPPFGSGLPPDASPAGRAQHAAANAAQRETFAAAQSSYAEALAKLGAAREPETFLLDALYHLPDRFVQMCVPSVEYPRSDAPPGLRFSGGYPNGPKDPFHPRPAWWPEVVAAKAAARKLVFVCQGTVAMDLTQLVVPTMAALAGREDVLVVVAVGRKGASLPPGLEVPPNCRVTDYVPFHDLGATFGSIIGLKLGSQNFVILNNYKHVRELFDKRGSIYSSRPRTYVANTLVCPGDIHLLLLPYGPAWRVQRRVVQSLLAVNRVDAVLPVQGAEATQTLSDLLRDPAGYYDHVRRYTTAVVLAAVYGVRGARFDSPNVRALYAAQDEFTAVLEQGATPPVDAFPFLKMVPAALAGWKRRAARVRREQMGLYLSLVAGTRERIREGRSPDCFLGEMLRDQEKNGLDDEHLAYLAGNLVCIDWEANVVRVADSLQMEAGSDTTASTLLSFLLAMIKYPKEFRKAQEEVDRVCGPLRSPTSEDIGRLPFIEACMNETLRWRPVAAGGVPHMLTQDDTYKGYHLPKGTVLVANTWAIHYDEDEYENPAEFAPDRFVREKYGTRDPVDESADDHRRVLYGFGAGRRVCPGQRLARNSLILNMAKIAWGFDLSPGEGEVDVDVGTAYTDGFLIAPKKFPITIRPRSERHAAVIEGGQRRAEPFFAKYAA
ncbi:Cytochrome P450 monooxygenase patH [Colletotrichum sp. SAR 10_86]|nr:Cytochrome P450 monooxygenase patH [Colletotrichum sp. SAR 10_86]